MNEPEEIICWIWSVKQNRYNIRCAVWKFLGNSGNNMMSFELIFNKTVQWKATESWNFRIATCNSLREKLTFVEWNHIQVYRDTEDNGEFLKNHVVSLYPLVRKCLGIKGNKYG